MQELWRFSEFPGPRAMYEYDLFSVVCHEGQINNGHYTCFARSRDEVGLIFVTHHGLSFSPGAVVPL